MTPTVVPFHDGLLPQAAELLAARHRRDRAALPLLPHSFADEAAAGRAATTAWQRPWTSGAAALSDDGRLLGYLFGTARFDTLRGRHAWVGMAGHALAADAPVDLYGPLYGAAGEVWLRHGCFDHYVLAPATDRAALEVWYALNFGQQQAHAVRGLDDLPVAPLVSGVTIRRGTPDDAAAVRRDLAPILWQHMTRAPVWAVGLPEFVDGIPGGFTELLAAENSRVWLAAGGDGQLLGYQAFEPVEAADDNPLAAEGVMALEVAGTREAARGRGIGRALTRHGLADARARGFDRCITDWRTANLGAHHLWPALGFTVAYYRLARSVDPRIAWAAA